jgi:hypothetical protein
MKKRITAALGVALVLAIAAVSATAVLADSDAKAGWFSYDKSFAPKKEIADIEGYLAKLVAAGKLTQAEADLKLRR